MGLIAREVERRGISTVSLTSAYSITASAKPPRAAFVDYPLGHTSGKPNDQESQLSIVRGALEALAKIKHSGEIISLDMHWSDHWKAALPQLAPAEHSEKAKDDRTERHARPQYQSETDQFAADPSCPTCVFLE